MVKRSAIRRRQRSVRIVVATILIGLATLGALPALIAQSALWLSVALVATLLCGWAAIRILCTEVLQARREGAAGLARQAVDHGVLSAERARENIEFSMTMSKRVKDRDRSIRELEGTIRLAEKRATVAEIKVKFETGRADEAVQRLNALQDELTAADARHAAEVRDEQSPAWDDQDMSTVVDLMNWEERTISQDNHRKHA